MPSGRARVSRLERWVRYKVLCSGRYGEQKQQAKNNCTYACQAECSSLGVEDVVVLRIHNVPFKDDKRPIDLSLSKLYGSVAQAVMKTAVILMNIPQGNLQLCGRHTCLRFHESTEVLWAVEVELVSNFFLREVTQ